MSDIRKFFGAASTSKKSTRSPKKSALTDERNNIGSPVKPKTRSDKLNVPNQSKILNLGDDDSDVEDPIPKSLKTNANKEKEGKRNARRVVLESSDEDYFDESIVSKAVNQNKPKKRSARLFSSDSDEPSKAKSPVKKRPKIISSSEESTPSPKKKGRRIKEPSPEYMEVDESEDEPEIIEQEDKKRGRRKRTPPNQKKIDAMLSKKIPANKQLPKNVGKPKEQLKKVDPLTFFGAISAKSKAEPLKVPATVSIVDVASSEDDEPIVKKPKTPVKTEVIRKSPRKPLNEIKKTPSPKKSASTTPEKPQEQIDPKKAKKPAVVLPKVKKQTTICVKMDCPPMIVSKRAELPWVDKYKPQDLKSLAGQNTDKSPAKKLLHWLREWSKNNLGVNGMVKKVKPNPFAAQHDGTAFKAALLSGPPGIGKTSAAVICCKELGLKFVEMNASDARNKKLLAEKTAELLGSRQIDEFLFGAKPSENSATEITHVLIMDEVDGMSGNQDRGGVAEVIQLIKDTKIPIICICNDRMHPKIRSLANHCFDLRFQRPRIEQIKARLLTIMAREKLKVPSEVLNDLMEASNHDIRQCIYSLQLIAAGAHGTIEKKDISVNIFEAARKILSKETNLATKQEMFFSDYSIMPLFVQENYPSVRGENVNIRTHLSALKKAAQCISDADVLDKEIRSHGSWNLLPEYGLMSCAIPAMHLDGHMTDQITFPSWLGKNSTSNKRQRMMRQLATHSHLKITGNCQAMVTDYVPLLRDRINRPLVNRDVDGVKEVIEVYKHYDLLREDTEAMEELGVWPGMKDIREKVSTKAKSALTRNLNKEVRLLPYSLAVAATKGKKKAVAIEEELDEEGHVIEKVVGANSDDDAENEDGEKEEDLPDIKIKTIEAGTKTTSKRGGETGRGGRGGRGRGNSRK